VFYESHSYAVNNKSTVLISDDGKRPAGDFVVQTTRSAPPVMLTKNFWTKFKYNINDIEETLFRFPALYVWHRVICEGLDPANAAIRASYDRLDSSTPGSEQSGIKRLLKEYRGSYPAELANGPSVLSTREDDFSSPPPMRTVSKAEFQKAYKLLPEEVQKDSKTPWEMPRVFRTATEYANTYDWEEFHFVPIGRLNPTTLTMLALTPAKTYEEAYGTPKCLAEEPLKFMINGNLWHDTDAVFYMVCGKA